ncbi:MAG TPA: hypothetical protein VLC46_22865 [Thermoanaerobaculia bacterium]|jgi:hypothetical protein|nr:hypothetical protein [Thermoanaerobaculia bacterium]
MTTMTRSLTSDSGPRKKRHAVTRAALLVVFWSVAALLVAIVHQTIDASSPVVSVILKVGAIVVIAAAFGRLAASESTLNYALFVGTTWVLLDIATEIFMTVRLGHQWFALLGSPANGGIRCVLLISWIIAPALFVRSRE